MRALLFLLSFNLLAFQRVDINQATREQLMTVEGLGRTMSDRILAHREEKGSFARLEDLMLIQGMKPKLYNRVKPKLQVGLPVRNSETDSKNFRKLSELNQSGPGVREVQEEALKYANAHPKQIRNWLSRAKKAYWLPKISGDVNPSYGDSDSLNASNANLIKSTKNISFHVKAEWHLNNLVFNRDELAIGREFLRQSLMRERILNRVNEAYFERKRLLVRTSSKLDLESEIRIQELEAELDGLTGGWFSGQIKSS